jgi:beta-galactosidase
MMKLGVCYYPEHWPESDWAEDARMMKAAGIQMVRIGEFAWSRIEPRQGVYEWGWLDRAIDLLHAEGLEIILGTPTATPPKWLVDAYPDILPVDAHGQTRTFGSRRHYCFSSKTYRAESDRMVGALARRYGGHPGIIMWQTDNEYGHHGSDESFSADAINAFRDWLSARYTDIDALNIAWGTVFWSQTYNAFSEIDPPTATVTEANPSHRLDWRRFCSDQMCRFNQAQVDIIRRHSPRRAVTHNFIGDFYRLDHRDLSKSLDLASWDSYPIGLLSEGRAPQADKARWLRTGDPDFAAFNHDVFRACAPRWAVMEQQPGPVNWATYNAAPAPGMVRLWTWEAFAHGADFVSYFRWRQAPFAQEQMHAGLLAPDRKAQPVLDEIGQCFRELGQVGPMEAGRADVAILMDYPSMWQQEIQPHGNQEGPLALPRRAYSACRRLGLNVDIVFGDSDLAGYRLVLVPGVTIMTDHLWRALKSSGATILATACSGSRTSDGQIPTGMPPGPMADDMDVRVERLETLSPFVDIDVMMDGQTFSANLWREYVETTTAVLAEFSDGHPAWVQNDRFNYLGCWPGNEMMLEVIRRLCIKTGVACRGVGRDVRLRRAGGVQFAFNYGADTKDLRTMGAPVEAADYLIGGADLAPAGVAAWVDRP